MVTITPLDPARSEAMHRWYDLVVAVGRHDRPDFPTPSRREHLARFAYPWPGTTEEALLAREGDRVVGAACYQLPRAENAGTLSLDLIVDPGRRGRGIGTRLLEEVCAAARRHRRRLIEVEAVRDAAAYHYLVKRGHRPGMTSIRSRCRLDDPARFAEAWPCADGYSLVRWRDAVPDEIVGDVAALQGRLMVDAPTGDLAVERQRYDAERMRAQERTERGRGFRWYSTAARHDPTGRIVARTKLSFEAADDTHARQRITIVEPAHRGHRLGLTVKAANHAFARANEPAVRVVDAWNAEENTHMRAVNAMLGFQPVDRWCVFQLPADNC